MKTTLKFEAPSDLSVGRLRLNDGNKMVAEWIATPDRRIFSQDDIKPGIYSVEVAPTGVAPQAVIFEVKEEQANTVSLPSFAALASGGGNTIFYDTATQRTTLQIPTQVLLTRARNPQDFSNTQPTLATFEPLRISVGTKRMSVALSQEASGHRDSYGRFDGNYRLELTGGGIAVEVHRPDFRFEPSDRVRLSLSIESLRIERCLVPMYMGGTTIKIAPSPISTSDVSIEVMPVQLRLRAMVRALGAGTVEEASAVAPAILIPPVESFLPVAPEVDPWAALVYGLLTVRFPEVFPQLERGWTQELVVHAGWAFDAHIIRANHILTTAGDDPQKQVDAAVAAVTHLERAQVAGAPYYAYANELFGEMIGGLSEPEDPKGPQTPIHTRELLAKIARRWSRENPLQRGAGVAFSWLRRDQKVLKATGTLVPNRRSTGILRGRDTTVVFQGRLGAGKITVGSLPGRRLEDQLGAEFDSPAPPNGEPTNRVSYPAMYRDPGPSDDPNKYRFGGQAERNGYSLEAYFGRAKRRGWVSITLAVTAGPEANMELGSDAWFFLHPTFSPSRVKVRFRGNRANLTIEAWGGFTVGVWIPSAQVELEADLSLLEHAPAIIRER